MTSVFESLRQLLTRVTEPEVADPPAPNYSYAIYWTKQARAWDTEHRARALARVESLMSRPDFIPNEFDRRYQVPEVDESAHSGASLVALSQVLKALGEP